MFELSRPGEVFERGVHGERGAKASVGPGRRFARRAARCCTRTRLVEGDACGADVVAAHFDGLAFHEAGIRRHLNPGPMRSVERDVPRDRLPWRPGVRVPDADEAHIRRRATVKMAEAPLNGQARREATVCTDSGVVVVAPGEVAGACARGRTLSDLVRARGEAGAGEQHRVEVSEAGGGADGPRRAGPGRTAPSTTEVEGRTSRQGGRRLGCRRLGRHRRGRLTRRTHLQARFVGPGRDDDRDHDDQRRRRSRNHRPATPGVSGRRLIGLRNFDHALSDATYPPRRSRIDRSLRADGGPQSGCPAVVAKFVWHYGRYYGRHHRRHYRQYPAKSAHPVSGRTVDLRGRADLAVSNRAHRPGVGARGVGAGRRGRAAPDVPVVAPALLR